MRLYFLIPLIVALISVYFYQKSDEEISYLTGSVTVISLVLSLVLAPWELQAGILVVAIVLVRNLWKKVEQQRELNEDPPEIPQENNQATLTDTLPETENQPKTERKYRGVTWSNEEVTPITTKPQKPQLKYRGVSQIKPESDNP
jgi:hypothetical protein